MAKRPSPEHDAIRRNRLVVESCSEFKGVEPDSGFERSHPALGGWRTPPPDRGFGPRLRAATTVMMGWSLVALAVWAGFWVAVLFAGRPYGLWRPIMAPVLGLALIHAAVAFLRARPDA